MLKNEGANESGLDSEPCGTHYFLNERSSIKNKVPLLLRQDPYEVVELQLEALRRAPPRNSIR